VIYRAEFEHDNEQHLGGFRAMSHVAREGCPCVGLRTEQISQTDSKDRPGQLLAMLEGVAASLREKGGALQRGLFLLSRKIELPPNQRRLVNGGDSCPSQ
jgi:hypothetical protein